MSEELDRSTVQRVAALAKLSFSDSELETLRGELTQVLTHIRQLDAVNTDATEPLAHAADLSNRLRDDRLAPSLSREAALRNAPHQDGEYFLVPSVFADASSKRPTT